ncbi:MAG: hypothetical protein RLZZ234_117 [Candidatus Parcubacteria bacterium]|jgi:hypothetical protein
METILTTAQVLFSLFTSLAVGGSTLAVLSVLHAFKDGALDASERSMLGVIYFVLRVAMGALLVLAVFLWWMGGAPFTAPLSGFACAAFTMLGVLYVNALLMTLHYMPFKIGPAIQAGAWYTLGSGAALMGAGVRVSYTMYIVLYLILVLVFAAVISGYMKYYVQKAG